MKSMRGFIVIGLIIMLLSDCVEEADFEVTELLVSASEVESGDSVVIFRVHRLLIILPI